ncbi:hypothetical protein Acav_0620 [Paracidovorax avenae ATCC 19860]|uniref:Uncharacterized protein n=1 Tax=Paracidovorax avenae (strain ATCC 19860 / DSM 7227 / CCUG 15838 / JCM 20985 / LMG 2117 / NCPPB 1011) TaxID=643561 RepID=F0Q6Y4_PARA1|nr:hypothetical protein Acav_0620 [Paracidovorax avenae ATCC 19860]
MDPYPRRPSPAMPPVCPMAAPFSRISLAASGARPDAACRPPRR